MEKQYIVLEKHSGNPTVVTNEDGDVMIFSTRQEADRECEDCQDGQVVNIAGEAMDDYLETHYEMVAAIERMKEKDGTMVNEIYEERGSGAMYELAREWTDEFQNKYDGEQWGLTKEWMDCIDEFIEEKIK